MPDERGQHNEEGGNDKRQVAIHVALSKLHFASKVSPAYFTFVITALILPWTEYFRMAPSRYRSILQPKFL
jgi:hypothetical protein